MKQQILPPTYMSLYDVLEVSRQATDAEIKKAYRSLSLRHHPDRPGGDSEKFKKISEAYEVLSDEHKRAVYDRTGVVDNNHDQGGGGGHNGGVFTAEDLQNLNPIFAHMFGNMGGGPGMHNIRIHRMGGGGGGIHEFFGGFGSAGGFFNQFIVPPAVLVQVSISLEQSYTGCMLPVKVERFIVQNEIRTNIQEEILIEIPEGVQENEVIVMEQRGNEVQGVRGDIRATAHIQPHPLFVRDHLNLIYRKNITLKESLCGFSFDVPLITGQSLTVKNINTVKVIRPGFQQVCHHYGIKRQNQTGDLVIDFHVVFPESLTAEQKETLQTVLP